MCLTVTCYDHRNAGRQTVIVLAGKTNTYASRSGQFCIEIIIISSALDRSREERLDKLSFD